MIHEHGASEEDERFRAEYAEHKRWSWYATVGVLMATVQFGLFILSFFFLGEMDASRVVAVRALLIAAMACAGAGVICCLVRLSRHERAMRELLPACTPRSERTVNRDAHRT